VKSKLTDGFRKRFKRLPPDIQKQAKAAYRLWKVNPYYPSLHFKCIDPVESIYSARVGLHYRVVGTKIGDTIIWDFIGTHEEYNHLL
jgi:mRNA-degrading endonuclease RelE of RelBE toxin-antitoxin system